MWVPRGVGASDGTSFAVGEDEVRFGTSVVINPERMVKLKP
ncbi:MAG TPA: hypothetical protein VMO26_02730 [Vicinamibacterales bacterium]|nr:hypothetical protein [Vicinamibacterales bacterium]